MCPLHTVGEAERRKVMAVCFANSCFPGCLAIDTAQPHSSLSLTRALFQITTKVPLLTRRLSRDTETNANSEIKVLSPDLPKRTRPEKGTGEWT